MFFAEGSCCDLEARYATVEPEVGQVRGIEWVVPSFWLRHRRTRIECVEVHHRTVTTEFAHCIHSDTRLMGLPALCAMLYVITSPDRAARLPLRMKAMS